MSFPFRAENKPWTQKACLILFCRDAKPGSLARHFFGARHDFWCVRVQLPRRKRMICNTIIHKIKDKIYGFLCAVERRSAFNAFFVCHLRLFVWITREKCDIKSPKQAFLSGDTGSSFQEPQQPHDRNLLCDCGKQSGAYCASWWYYLRFNSLQ